MQSSQADPSIMSLRALRYIKGTAALGLVTVLALLAACSAPAPSAEGGAPPSPAHAADAVRYRVEEAHSEVLIWVRSEGPLAYLGHNHIILVGELAGELWLPPDPSRAVFTLAFPVAALRLDEPELRAQQGEGYEETLSAQDIAGTRAHMLDTGLLDGADYPVIELYSESISGSAAGWIAHTVIRVRSRAAHVDVPVKFESTPGGVTLSGEFSVTHTMLGLVPHSALLGSLRVAQPLRIRFRIAASR